ncbi:hypothetical protein BDN70DRAFT_810886 [Pholiota conissans]|uniref:Six-hairpin glycosidase n=1 Tax=Pholiota conissans TaxID=109636 RepID=A0A9P5YX56_9AGAR|nr:hypothetical protein BDN70DRAFT_810886 [Pholiota conissans]
MVFASILQISLGSSASSSSAVPFSPGFDIESVISLAVSLPSHSWEFGTASEALLELYDASHAVYGAHPFPVPTLLPKNTPSLAYAQEKIVIGDPPNGLSDGDGAVGDPASLGVSAVLLGKTDAKYAQAAAAEVEYLLSGAPRWWNGAISHRAMYAELWADFIYMAPPFMAYYGVATHNASILKAAADQCILYQKILVANTTVASPSPPTTHPITASGLWTHILGPINNDPGIWSTGNAWAAAGTMRVLATLIKAPSSLFNNHGPKAVETAAWRLKAAKDLVDVIRSILDGAIRSSADQGLLRNYLDDPTWFGEISGSSLLASVAYRLATLSSTASFPGRPLLSKADSQKYISFAEGVRKTLGSDGHITANGTATPAVNPLGWGDRNPFTAGSPEGQNFVVLLYAAWRDCVKANIKGCRA